MSIIYRPNWIIKPTHDCNFNCKYCYDIQLKQKYAGQVMGMDVFERIVQMACKYGASIVFHGGEPTLVGLEWYREAFSIVDYYHGMDCGITFGMQTNGSLLNDEWFELMKPYFRDFGVSYDFHAQGEMRRDYAFEEMVKTATRYNIKVGAISVITKSNIDFLWEIYMEATRIGLKSISLNPLFLSPEVRISGIRLLSGKDIKVGYGSFFRRYLACPKPKLYERVAESYLSNFRGSKMSVCNFSDCRASYVCISPNGEVYPCDRHFPEKYCYGNIIDFHDTIDFLETSGFSRYYHDTQKRLNQSCVNCKYLHLCHGGCSGGHMASGTITVASNELCNGLHAFYETICEVLQSG